MGRIALVLLILGGFLCFKGSQEYKLASSASDTPQKISCADLAANGPGDNAYVELTDYTLANWIVYREKDKSKSWQEVYIPAIPPPTIDPNNPDLLALQAALEKPKEIKVLIKSEEVANESEVSKLETPPLRGMVVNKIEKLGSEEKKFLQQGYGTGIDFDKCWIIEHNREPGGSGKVTAFFGGGIAALVIGGLLGVVAIKNKKF